MEPENLPQESPRQEHGDAPQDPTPTPDQEPYKPYSKSTRIKAWIGIVFMVFLVIMYTYSLASGKIMNL